MERSMIDLFGNSVQLLGMPLSSAALFLLAGTLLGHLLWYRDRGKSSPTDPDLETRYLKVRSSLKQRKTQVKELQKQNASLDEDLTILRQAHSTLRSKNSFTTRRSRVHRSRPVVSRLDRGKLKKNRRTICRTHGS